MANGEHVTTMSMRASPRKHGNTSHGLVLTVASCILDPAHSGPRVFWGLAHPGRALIFWCVVHSGLHARHQKSAVQRRICRFFHRVIRHS